MKGILFGSLLLFFPFIPASADIEFEQCLLKQLQTAADVMTVGDIKQYCRDLQLQQAQTPNAETDVILEESAISRRAWLEQQESNNPFVLLPHKPNYIMLSNNMADANEAPFEQENPDDNIHFQPWETKFQISLKLPLVRGLFGNRADWFAAYTNRSFWQQFNHEGSAPFRETNHEPETWLSFKNDTEFWGLKNALIRTGISHQSNGQSGLLSRSWNRVYAEFVFETESDWYFSLKPWWRIPDPADNDDNPDIEKYMGNFEFGALYQAGQHNFDLMLRNNLNFGHNYGAVQLGWSFPISDRVRGYVQWFNGYGESLIDYDAHSNSIGFGIQLSDWL